MKNLKNIIFSFSLFALDSLNCQADALGRGTLQVDQDVAAPESFDFLGDFFYFDARSLFWLLIGGAIGAAAVFTRLHAARAAAPGLKISPNMQPAISEEVTVKNLAGREVAHSSKYWIGLDEATTVTVEELSRIEEEAEVFLMAGHPDVAIKVLRDYLLAEPDCKAYVWFKLLDIYHVQSMREPFDRLAQQINTRFNVALPTWEVSRAEVESRQGLEHFPNLLAKIVQRWNDPSGLEYLRELMRDNRQGKRSGFHEEAFWDMLLLSDVLEVRQEESEAATK